MLVERVFVVVFIVFLLSLLVCVSKLSNKNTLFKELFTLHDHLFTLKQAGMVKTTYIPAKLWRDTRNVEEEGKDMVREKRHKNTDFQKEGEICHVSPPS